MIIPTRPSRNQKDHVEVLMKSPEIPPPLTKGGEGGFLKFVANLRTKSFPRHRETKGEIAG